MDIKKLIVLFSIIVSGIDGFSQKKWAHVSNDSMGKRKNGILSETGLLIVPVKYDAVVGGNGYYFVKLNSFWGCYKEGKLLIPTEYENLGFKISGELIKAKKRGKWGFVNFNNKVVVPFKYDFVCNFVSDKAYVQIGENGFHIDSSGNVLDSEKQNDKYCPEDLMEDTENRNQFRDGLLEVVKNNDKFGVIEKRSNKILIPFEFDEIKSYYNNIITVRKGNKWGAYTDTGTLISAAVFDSISIFIGD